MIILDGEGNELANCVGPNGNIGCPVAPEEIAHFVGMIKQSSDATEAELAKITEAMNLNSQKIKQR